MYGCIYIRKKRIPVEWVFHSLDNSFMRLFVDSLFLFYIVYCLSKRERGSKKKEKKEQEQEQAGLNFYSLANCSILPNTKQTTGMKLG